MAGKKLEYNLQVSFESQAKISIWPCLSQNVRTKDPSTLQS